MKHHTFEDGLKYKPDYKWPKPGTEKKCPTCKRTLELCNYRKLKPSAVLSGLLEVEVYKLGCFTVNRFVYRQRFL